MSDHEILMVRLRKVREMTGWNDKFIAKLVKAGLLTAWRPFPKAQAWYYTAEVRELLNRERNQPT